MGTQPLTDTQKDTATPPDELDTIIPPMTKGQLSAYYNPVTMSETHLADAEIDSLKALAQKPLNTSDMAKRLYRALAIPDNEMGPEIKHLIPRWIRIVTAMELCGLWKEKAAVNSWTPEDAPLISREALEAAWLDKLGKWLVEQEPNNLDDYLRLLNTEEKTRLLSHDARLASWAQNELSAQQAAL
jgi:hypothetical protein